MDAIRQNHEKDISCKFFLPVRIFYMIALDETSFDDGYIDY